MDYSESAEMQFDVAKSSEMITFLGLLDRSDGSGNELTALFDWRCPGCSGSNRDVALIQSFRTFLCGWSCRHCERATLVRFKARASSEWIAQHTLAVTGRSIDHLTEEELPGDVRTSDSPRYQSRNQRLLAAIAIPALLILIGLGLSDMRRVADSSASPSVSPKESYSPAVVSRLLGRWTSDDGNDTLYFVRIDAREGVGEYTHVFPGARSGQRLYFDVIHTDPRGEQLVIRQWQARTAEEEIDDPLPRVAWESTIHVPLQGHLLTWIDFRTGDPILKVYHEVMD